MSSGLLISLAQVRAQLEDELIECPSWLRAWIAHVNEDSDLYALLAEQAGVPRRELKTALLAILHKRPEPSSWIGAHVGEWLYDRFSELKIWSENDMLYLRYRY